ncbi:hypothetical protein DSM14862_02614 [Sulfitobacter indolifex]|nr:hypothetical protein DSM14862_02614 [Sulfitobacter indolifex]
MRKVPQTKRLPHHTLLSLQMYQPTYDPKPTKTDAAASPQSRYAETATIKRTILGPTVAQD